MRRFSRWMPPQPAPRTSILAWCMFLAVWAALSPLLIIAHLITRRHFRRLARHRRREDIGTFARAFDRRKEPFDPWVIRATWDAIGIYGVADGCRLPLRPTDRIAEDLWIDPEDINDLIPEVAARSGHSLGRPEDNPLYGKVATVGDFV